MTTLHKVLLSAHILTAMFTVGWLMTTAFVAPTVIRRGNLPVLQFIGMVSQKVGPAAGLVFLLGLWLVGEGGAEFSDKWVSWAMVLFIAAMVNGAVFMARTERAAGAKIAAGQPATAEATRVTILALVNLVLLVTIVYLMVAKPGSY